MKADQAAAVIKEMEKEVLTMFRLEHPNIVKLLGVTDGELGERGVGVGLALMGE